MRVVAAAFGCELSFRYRDGQLKSSPLYQLGDATAGGPEAAKAPDHRQSSRRARAGQGPVLASLAMLAIGRCAWLRVAPLLP
jgi:hypothetical protein